MKVTGMCLPENENRGHAFGVGFRRKKGVIGCGIQKKKMGLFGVNFPKYGVIYLV